MKIKQIKSQHRRDMTVLYECEHCENEQEGDGYDDTYFHTKVIPNMKCLKCGKKAPDDYRALTPKYADSQTV